MAYRNFISSPHAFTTLGNRKFRFAAFLAMASFTFHALQGTVGTQNADTFSAIG
jgi:hypothetical protein